MRLRNPESRPRVMLDAYGSVINGYTRKCKLLTCLCSSPISLQFNLIRMFPGRRRFLYCHDMLMISQTRLPDPQNLLKFDALFVQRWFDANAAETDFWTNTYMRGISGTSILWIILLIWFNKRRRCNNSGRIAFVETPELLLERKNWSRIVWTRLHPGALFRRQPRSKQ